MSRILSKTCSARTRSDFSIARILGKERSSSPESARSSSSEHVQITFRGESSEQHEQRFEWLQCTRYRPPRLPRSRRREGAQRRKLGRNPRIPFSSSQVAVLEQRFARSQYLSSADVAELAAFLALSETRVKIWFQNRRARERRDREARQRCSSDSPCDNNRESASLAHVHGLNLSLSDVRERRRLSEIARVHGLATTSAFVPVHHLAVVTPIPQPYKLTNKMRGNCTGPCMNYSATTIRSATVKLMDLR